MYSFMSLLDSTSNMVICNSKKHKLKIAVRTRLGFFCKHISSCICMGHRHVTVNHIIEGAIWSAFLVPVGLLPTLKKLYQRLDLHILVIAAHALHCTELQGQATKAAKTPPILNLRQLVPPRNLYDARLQSHSNEAKMESTQTVATPGFLSMKITPENWHQL